MLVSNRTSGCHYLLFPIHHNLAALIFLEVIYCPEDKIEQDNKPTDTDLHIDCDDVVKKDST